MIRKPRTELQILRGETPKTEWGVTTLKKTCRAFGITKDDLNFLMQKRGNTPGTKIDSSAFRRMIEKVADKIDNAGYSGGRFKLTSAQIFIAEKDSADYCSKLLYEANRYQKQNWKSHISGAIGAVVGAGIVIGWSALMKAPIPTAVETGFAITSAALGYLIGAWQTLTFHYNTSKKEKLVQVAFGVVAAVKDAFNTKIK